MTPHDPEMSEHGLAENTPLLSEDCHVMIPVGEWPVTVALHVLG